MKRLMVLSLAALLLASCGSKEEKKEGEEKTSAENAKPSKERIAELDNEFLTATTIDEKKAKEFIGLCLEYADAYPEDEKTPFYLERGALVAGAIGKYSLKTKMFQYIIDQHRAYPNYTNILYLQAVCWDTEMKNKEQAKKFYHMTMEQHKDSGILASAEARLATVDSLTFEQHEQKLIEKLTNQLSK